jgi:ABC-type transport system substrate-binding protein
MGRVHFTNGNAGAAGGRTFCPAGGGNMRIERLIGGAMIALALASTSALAETPKNTLVVADAIDDIITLDPGEVSEVGGVLAANQIYQPLVSVAPDDSSKIIGVLAESWTASEDGKTYTFKMRSGLKFASGNPVTAKDAEYSLRRVVAMKSRSAFILTQFGFSPENVKDRIKATDDRTLVIEIGDTYAPSFLYYCLSSYVGGIVDSKLVQEHEVNGDFGNAWLKAENSAGSGPYVPATPTIPAKAVAWSASSSSTFRKAPPSACCSKRVTSISPTSLARTISERWKAIRMSASSKAFQAPSTIWASTCGTSTSPSRRSSRR